MYVCVYICIYIYIYIYRYIHIWRWDINTANPEPNREIKNSPRPNIMINRIVNSWLFACSIRSCHNKLWNLIGHLFSRFDGIQNEQPWTRDRKESIFLASSIFNVTQAQPPQNPSTATPKPKHSNPKTQAQPPQNPSTATPKSEHPHVLRPLPLRARTCHAPLFPSKNDGNCHSRLWQLPKPALATATAGFGNCQSRLWQPKPTLEAANGNCQSRLWHWANLIRVHHTWNQSNPDLNLADSVTFRHRTFGFGRFRNFGNACGFT